jgi:hypothetical protein
LYAPGPGLPCCARRTLSRLIVIAGALAWLDRTCGGGGACSRENARRPTAWPARVGTHLPLADARGRGVRGPWRVAAERFKTREVRRALPPGEARRRQRLPRRQRLRVRASVPLVCFCVGKPTTRRKTSRNVDPLAWGPSAERVPSSASSDTSMAKISTGYNDVHDDLEMTLYCKFVCTNYVKYSVYHKWWWRWKTVIGWGAARRHERTPCSVAPPPPGTAHKRYNTWASNWVHGMTSV